MDKFDRQEESFYNHRLRLNNGYRQQLKLQKDTEAVHKQTSKENLKKDQKQRMDDKLKKDAKYYLKRQLAMQKMNRYVHQQNESIVEKQRLEKQLEKDKNQEY